VLLASVRDDVPGERGRHPDDFIALKLTSLSLYVLAAFNKRDIKSAEASLKYFFVRRNVRGVHVIWPEPDLRTVRRDESAGNRRSLAGKGLDPLLVVAIVMVVIGFGFKSAAVPFHLWAPDAYQGARRRARL